MKLTTFTQITAASLALCSATSYAASDDALLDLLVKKGVLSRAEATEVAQEVAANEEIKLSAKGKETIDIRFNGRIQAQYDGLGMDDNGTDTPTTSHFYFRRLFFGVKAKLQNGIFAETVFDFAGDDSIEVAFDKAIIGYKFDDAFTGILGFQKVPFGFEETTSSSKLQTIERSAANRFFADDIDFSSRHMGLHAEGDLGGGFSYAAALVNSVQGEGSRLGGSSEASNDFAAFARVQWANDNVTVGFDVGKQVNNIKADGTSTGLGLGVNDVTAYTGYVNYKLNGLDLLGEYFYGDLDAFDKVSAYTFRASYKIDKIEPVFRYAHVKADTFVIDTDELIRRAPNGGTVAGTDNEIDSYYFGANYYLSKATTLMLGYEIANAENSAGTDEADVDGLRARVQVLW